MKPQANNQGAGRREDGVGRRRIRLLGVTVALAGLVGALGASATAAPAPESVEVRGPSTDSTVVPVAGAAAAPSLGEPLTSTSAHTRLDTGVGVSVRSESGSWVGLRKQKQTEATTRGVGVAHSKSRDVDTVAQTSARAGRIMEVIHEPESSHEFDYAVEMPAGKQLVLQA
ncbi:MAG: hypothetical protein ACRCYU_20615, partial [Nocardioides sp.]